MNEQNRKIKYSRNRKTSINIGTVRTNCRLTKQCMYTRKNIIRAIDYGQNLYLHLDLCIFSTKH